MKRMKLENMLKKGTALLLTTVLLAGMGAQTAFAATKINTVSITLSLDLDDGASLPNLTTGYANEDEAEIKIPSNNKYEITDAEWSKDVDEMEMGKTYTIKVTLDAIGDYEFKSSYSSSKVTVKGGTFVSARRNSSDELVVTVKTREVEGTLEEPEDPRWMSEKSSSDKFGYAKWDSVDEAAYDVNLYRNDKVVHKVTDWNKTSYNFYPYMTKEGDYSFRVRAIPRNEDVEKYAEKSEWSYSDSLYVDEDEVSDGTGQGLETDNSSAATTNTDQVGWIANGGKWFFRYPDGTYLRDSWGKINDIWYLFGSTGEMLTGWHNVNGRYYYMNQDGAMKTGWLKENDTWYYLNADGDMRIGWLTEGDKTYYLETNGAMVTGWKEISGQFYYFYPDGHKAVNEVINGFYVDNNGIWKRP